jgi:hypothetical protein
MKSDMKDRTAQVPPPQARKPAKPGRRPRPGWPAELPKTPLRPASPTRPPGPGRSGRPVRTADGSRPATAVTPETGQFPPTTTRQTAASPAWVPSDAVPQPAAAHAGRQQAQFRPSTQVRRTSFVLLLVGLLGGGLVCLLVVNTTLAANSIEIYNLQQRNAQGAQQVQQLEQQVAQAQTAGVIAREAWKLGLRPQGKLIFINLRSKRIVAQPGTTRADLAGRRVPVATASPSHQGRGRGKSGKHGSQGRQGIAGKAAARGAGR